MAKRSRKAATREEATMEEPKHKFPKLVADQAASALLLMKQLQLDAKIRSSNVFYSPLSIHVAMCMLAAGSQGPTQDQLLSFLGGESTDQLNQFSSAVVHDMLADGTPRGGPKLLCSNGLWVNKSLHLRDSFKKILDTAYDAEIASPDFRKEGTKVMKEVNKWVNTKTNGLIPTVLNAPPDPDTTIILLNAVYFKGMWVHKFRKSETEDRHFFLFGGNQVKVPFMTSGRKQALIACDGFKVLRLPYMYNKDDRRFSMCIFLPDARDDLPTLVNKVCSDPGFLDSHVPYKTVRVGKFWIPKFKMSFEFEATPIMKQMGLVMPFSVGDGFTGMAEPPENKLIGVSRVVHKSFIEVNEEGTEAAAVTVKMTAGRARSSFREKPINFVADHPFLFAIREDKSKAILFVGQVVNPKQE